MRRYDDDCTGTIVSHATCLPINDDLLGFVRFENERLLRFPAAKILHGDTHGKYAAARALYFQAGLDAAFVRFVEGDWVDSFFHIANYPWREQQGQLYCCVDAGPALSEIRKGVEYFPSHALPDAGSLHAITINHLIAYHAFARAHPTLPKVDDAYVKGLWGKIDEIPQLCLDAVVT